MTHSEKVLLKTLLNVEHESIKFQKSLENHSVFSFTFHSNNTFDLFDVITSAFNISENKYDSLYNILNNFYNDESSSDEIIKYIQELLK